MSCPCELTKEEVKDLDQRDRVPLVGGLCQNPFITPDGTLGICGKPLGAHPSAPSAVSAPGTDLLGVRFADIVEEKFEEKFQKLTFNMSKQFHDIKPSFEVVSQTLTPSEACKTDYGSTLYIPLLRSLMLDPTLTPYRKNAEKSDAKEKNAEQSDAKEKNAEKSDAKEKNAEKSDAKTNGPRFSFQWIIRDSKISEAQSYEPARAFLQSLFPGDFVGVIANGQGLNDGLLYITRVFNLKPRLATTHELRKENGVPRLCFIVRGRSDLVKLRTGATLLIPENVEFVVEIKPTYELHENDLSHQAFRESVIQLIGLNVGNAQCSPAVVLTNLSKKHYILYIDYTPPLSYVVRIDKMTTFADACRRASEIGKRCITRDFGRAPTPGSTPPKSNTPERQEEDSDEQAESGNVEIDGMLINLDD